MIYSILKHKEVPVYVEKKYIPVNDGFDDIVRYDVYDETTKNFVGYVDLQDTEKGVKVDFIKNQNPDLYKHFGQLADQIELEHCLNRGIKKPYIESVAAIGTHVMHFLRGKRFINKKINKDLYNLTKNLQKGEKISVGQLGCQRMYMPINLINKIRDKIKINRILKNVK